jgi:Na+/H+ antiporter NhaD/arsenite permease-like protein
MLGSEKEMPSIVPIMSVLVLFVGIMIIFTKEKADYVAYSLLAAFIACIMTALYFEVTLAGFIQFVEFEPLVFIICMQITIVLIERHKIFQWIALKTLYITKGDHRKFFYFICIIASISSAIISDITIGIILVPLVIRACKILKIDATPYLFGLSFTINIGSIYTPFSSSENVLISNAFGLDLQWFLGHFTLIVFPIILSTLFIIDVTMLRKIEPPKEEQKKILMEIMHPNLVIIDRKKFIANFIYFIVVIICFFIFPQAYLVAMAGAIVISLLNKKPFVDTLEKVDWKVICFLVAMFLLIGCMQINGTFDYIKLGAEYIIPDDVFWAAVVIMLMIGVLSGFLAQIPTAIVFITLLLGMYEVVPPIILMGLILGINIGSNFLPQGAACDLITLNLAAENGIEGFNYKTLLKNGSKMTLIHIATSVFYLFIFALVTGVI